MLEILADLTPAYAYEHDDPRWRQLSALLEERAIPFHLVGTPGLAVVQLEQPVLPDQLPAHLRL